LAPVVNAPGLSYLMLLKPQWMALRHNTLRRKRHSYATSSKLPQDWITS